ncbi:MAG: hypothetical protein KatS3mg105_2344 [Gemmatales bacterium]|nr:MAG: hypothetical protein KatS3mg105_2344 [Gemmatales bacterium]
MFNLGATELIALLAIGVLLFGQKLPSVARSLGRSVIAFKEGLHGIEEDIDGTAGGSVS